jgi:membrane-bound lytic murein transglycosylase A
VPPKVHNTAKSRWVEADWSDLPGWDADQVVHAWPALLRSCFKPATEFDDTCRAAQALPAPDDTSIRAFLRERLRPWRVESQIGRVEGLSTGYFEPLVVASRRARPGFEVPLYAPPPGLAARKPWFTREQMDTLPAAQGALRGREIAFVADRLDALLLQIQGSGRLDVTEPDGSRRLVRVSYTASNEHPYRSIGRWLVEQGELTAEAASWPAIRQWARSRPQRVDELVQANPRVIFFREEALADPTQGPLGAQGVPLTPGRSIAVDKHSIPYGTPVWFASTEPQRPGSTVEPRPLQRLVVAQDTGSAITGALRADYFWGWGDGAEEMAGRMRQSVRMWVLWPKDDKP